MYVYEVKKTVNDKTTSHGFYRHERAAIKAIAHMEKSRFSRLAHEIARMTGWKRGKNSERFNEIIYEMANSPYSVVEITVNANYY